MVDATSRETRVGAKAQGRKFYGISEDYRRGGKPPFRLENKDAVLRYLWINNPPRYSEFPEKPCFHKKNGRPLRDIEGYVGHWFISDRTKAVLEEVDQEAFAFTTCDVRLPDGATGPNRWLCTVLRVLDALDDEASQVRIEQDQGQKIYMLNMGMRLVFRDDVVGTAHIFRMAHMEPKIICDQAMKDACKRADLKGFYFRDVLKY